MIKHCIATLIPNNFQDYTSFLAFSLFYAKISYSLYPINFENVLQGDQLCCITSSMRKINSIHLIYFCDKADFNDL